MGWTSAQLGCHLFKSHTSQLHNRKHPAANPCWGVSSGFRRWGVAAQMLPRTPEQTKQVDRCGTHITLVMAPMAPGEFFHTLSTAFFSKGGCWWCFLFLISTWVRVQAWCDKIFNRVKQVRVWNGLDSLCVNVNTDSVTINIWVHKSTRRFVLCVRKDTNRCLSGKHKAGADPQNYLHVGSWDTWDTQNPQNLYTPNTFVWIYNSRIPFLFAITFMISVVL